MKFQTAQGTKRTLKNSSNYLIDWSTKSRSKFQTKVKDFLQPHWKYDIVFEEMPVVGTRLSIDLYNANKKIAIEVQGGQHIKFTKFFHGDRLGYLDQLKRDEKKAQFCAKNNIHLVEIYPDDEIGKEIFESKGVFL